MFESLETLDDLNAPAREKAFTKFPCEHCAGTGRYRGVRIHQSEARCFACDGRGWFKSSAHDRAKGRAASKARKVNKLVSAQAAFNEQHPGLIEALRPLAGWHQFAASLLQQYGERGALSEKQVAAGWAAVEKQKAREAEKVAKRQERSGVVDIAGIQALFDKARASGLKKPHFRTDVLKISVAPPTSRNAGALYVKHRNEYAGKIVGSTFQAAYGAAPEVLSLLQELAANPEEVARKYGRETGSCCCCGRELTDPASVAAGIGPDCAANWGL